MYPLQGFFDELLGPNWTVQGVAVVVASCLALTSAAVSAWVSVSQGRKTRMQARTLFEAQSQRDTQKTRREDLVKNREQWWERFTWAAERIYADNKTAIVAGQVLSSIQAVQWISDEDRELVNSVLDANIESVPASLVSEVLNAQNNEG